MLKMASSTPKIGTVLHNDNDEDALVVPDGTTLIDGLLMLVEEVYGGERFAPDNPAIVAALEHAYVGVWHSCSVRWAQDNNVDTEGYNGWWAPDGDGKRSITVASYSGSAYVLGEMAEAAGQDSEVAD